MYNQPSVALFCRHKFAIYPKLFVEFALFVTQYSQTMFVNKKKNGLFGIAARGWIDTSYIKPIEITW